MTNLDSEAPTVAPIESAEVALKSKLDQPLEVEFTGDENKQRGNWTGKMDFMLSCIGYAVGLGNIWRFPYLCYKNGGGAFLIPYFCFLILCGMPLVFLEMSFGQFSSLSPIAIWKICPIFKGLGYGMVIISGIVCIYYNIIIAWTLFYLVSSFRAQLPWASCLNYWNTDSCAQRSSFNESANASIANASQMAVAANVSGRQVTPSEEFWKYRVLNITSGIEDLGGIRWELFAALLVAWVLVFLCLVRGVKSSGKVVYVTAIFPYLVLILLCIRGVTLPGAVNGLKLYLLPKWHKLLEFTVWADAAMQIFYSVGAAWGALITMSSYNRFRNNCLRDAVIVPLLNCGTSVFAGLVIFSIIGFIQSETGSPIEDVVDQGPGLIFVVYPEALTKIFLSPVWSVLFFLMIFTVGLDSQFGMFETMISAFTDEFPKRLSNKKILITALLVAVEFGIGVVCVTRGGIFVLQIMDWYSSTFSLMIISFFECVVIGWIYGADRFYRDIELMLGRQPSAWWRICWRFITPAIILCIFIISIVNHSPVTYGPEDNKYRYPKWAINIGMCLALMSLLPLPLLAIVALYGGSGSLPERIKNALLPSPEWGPMVERFRDQWLSLLSSQERIRTLACTGGKVEGFDQRGSAAPGVAGVHGKVQREDEEDICLNPESSLKTVFASKLTVDSSAN
ncbi:hypothetical protein BOX15_Mlig031699g3 [Macrostomum lignano]|uniref:Transporter n=1 Tax=Macrostomum lignano TaxID=282301 RepID=A0A267EUE8_9PLAT|nr:hypothetical protein BOX15_Mlig031699g3 [Macrostomum lignano]